MPGITKDEDRFQTLVQVLSEKLGPSSGIDSSDVDEKELQQLMVDYISDETEWAKYFFPAPNMAYTRNLVDKGNGKSNLLILVWSPGKSSPIHDDFVADLMVDASFTQETYCLAGAGHANAHCIMKILKGSLVETRYAWPTVDLNNTKEQPLSTISEKTYEVDQVTYMSDKLGLHRISNPDPNDYAVSLHLYTPPNAAVYGCNIFDEDTGHAKHIKKCTVFSEYGARPGAA